MTAMNPVDRTGCTGRFHGDESAYRQGCRCSDAREDRRIKEKRRRYNVHTPAYVDVTGTLRRLRALAAIGWPVKDLGPRLGISTQQMDHYRSARKARIRGTVAARIEALYDQLSATPGPSAVSRDRATRNGWEPPLLWEDVDIDDPLAQPATDEPVRTRAQIDLAEVDFFTGPLGMTLEDAATRIGVQPGSIRIAQARARQRVAA
jgi:hypothetical protein